MLSFVPCFLSLLPDALIAAVRQQSLRPADSPQEKKYPTPRAPGIRSDDQNLLINMSPASDPPAPAAQTLGPDRPSSLKGGKGSWVTVSLQRLVQHRLGNFPRRANTFVWARSRNRNNSTANGRPVAENIPAKLPGPPAEPAPDPVEPGPPPGEEPGPVPEESPVLPQDPQQHNDNHHQRQASREDVLALKAALDRLDSSTAAIEDSPDSNKHSPHRPAKGTKHRRSISPSEVRLKEDDVDGITLHDSTETSGLKIHETISKNSSQGSTLASSKRGRHRISRISLKSLANTHWLRQRRRKHSQHSPFLVLTAENVQVTRHITVEYHRQLSPPLHPVSPPGPDCRIAAGYPDYVSHQALFGGRLARLAAQDQEAGDAAGPIAADLPSVFRRGRPRTTSLTAFSTSDQEQGAAEEQAEEFHTPLSPRPYRRQPSVVSHISANPGQGHDETPAAAATINPVQFLKQPGKFQGERRRRRSFQDSSIIKLRKSKRNRTRSRTESPHTRTELRPDIVVPPTPALAPVPNHFPAAAAAKAKVAEPGGGVDQQHDQAATSDSSQETPAALPGQQQGETI